MTPLRADSTGTASETVVKVNPGELRMQLNQTIVWLDHIENHVTLFNALMARMEKIKSHPRHSNLHARAEPRHIVDDPRYFGSVVHARQFICRPIFRCLSRFKKLENHHGL